MTLKGRLSSLVSTKDADARDTKQTHHALLPDHIPAAHAGLSSDGLSAKSGRQPERGSLSISRHGTPTSTPSCASDDQVLWSHRSLDFGRQPRSPPMGSLSMNSLNRAAVVAGAPSVRTRPCADDPVATVVEVEVADTDGSSFAMCARAVTANNGGVRAASFELEGGVLGVTSVTLVPRFADAPDVRARRVQATVARIEAPRRPPSSTTSSRRSTR